MTRREKQEGFPGERLVVVPRPVVAVAIKEPLLVAAGRQRCGAVPASGSTTWQVRFQIGP